LADQLGESQAGRGQWGDKAESTLEVEMVAHATAGAWIKNILLVLTGSSADAPQYDVNVKLRSSGKVLYSLLREVRDSRTSLRHPILVS
jgi:hypothetical protein